MRRAARGAHPFFWAALAVLPLALYAAGEVDAPAPAVALGSGVLHRVEVGLAAALAQYAVVVLLWLAYHGRSFSRLELGGAAAEVPDGGELESAGRQLEEYVEKTDRRLDLLEDSVEQHEERLDAAGPPPGGGGSRPGVPS